MNVLFSFSDLKLAKMTKDQDQCIFTSNIYAKFSSSISRFGLDNNNYNNKMFKEKSCGKFATFLLCYYLNAFLLCGEMNIFLFILINDSYTLGICAYAEIS